MLLLEDGGRDARRPETTDVHHRQADGKGISLNRMGYLWDSHLVCRLCDLNLTEWIEIISGPSASFLSLMYKGMFTQLG